MDKFRMASKPTFLEYYTAVNYMCNFSTKDVFLLFIKCIYKRNKGQSDWDFISGMFKKDKTLTNTQKKILKNFENKEVNLQICDVLLLKKIIFYILPNFSSSPECSFYKVLHHDYNTLEKYIPNEKKELVKSIRKTIKYDSIYITKEFSYSCIKEMREIVRYLAEKRGGFAHTEEAIVTIDNAATFNEMKVDFIQLSEMLINSTKHTTIFKKNEDEIKEHFNKIMTDLNQNWPLDANFEQVVPYREIQLEINEDELAHLEDELIIKFTLEIKPSEPNIESKINETSETGTVM